MLNSNDIKNTLLPIGDNITVGNIKGDIGGDEIKSLDIIVPPKVSWADVVAGKQ